LFEQIPRQPAGAEDQNDHEIDLLLRIKPDIDSRSVKATKPLPNQVKALRERIGVTLFRVDIVKGSLETRSRSTRLPPALPLSESFLDQFSDTIPCSDRSGYVGILPLP
jgi:hypothetical protein